MILDTSTPSRYRAKAVLGGVCAGLAQQLGFSTWGARLAVIVCGCFFTLVTVLSYLIAWALMRVE